MRSLDEQSYIRDQLFAGGRPLARRYADLVVGPEAGLGRLVAYELTTTLLGGLPGALGLALRRLFYPRLFRRCGAGVVFGRDLVIRNAHLVEIGERTMLDDGCVIDGRGAGPAGLVVGRRVILGRGVSVQAKVGPIAIGDDSDIGMGTVIHSQGGVEIGRAVVMGGGCKLSGGVFQTERTADDGGAVADAGEGMRAREQTRWTRGPIRIGDKCLIGFGAMFLDGVEVGQGAVVGAGSVVVSSVPPYSVAAGVPARVLRARRPALAATTSDDGPSGKAAA